MALPLQFPRDLQTHSGFWLATLTATASSTSRWQTYVPTTPAAKGASPSRWAMGTEHFKAPLFIRPAHKYSLSIVLGDFNGDGKLDVAVMNQSASIGILLGNGDGTLKRPWLPIRPRAFPAIIDGPRRF